MAKGEETRRVQFTLPASLVDAIDNYCERSRMSRSTFVEYTLASALSVTDKLVEGVVAGVSDKMTGEAASLG